MTDPAPSPPSANPLPAWVKPALGVLLLGGLIAGGAVAHYKLSPYHFLVVEPGVLYRSGALSSDNFHEVVEDYGIKTVVNLRSDEDRDPEWFVQQRADCEALGVELVPMPIHSDTPPNEAQLQQWLELLQDESRQPILVHCKQGVVRTAEMVAVYEVEFRGRTGPQVFEDLPKFGHDFEKPKRRPVKEFITTYEPRLGKRARPE